MKIHQHLYIGGEWIKPHGNMTADVTNSATEAVIGRICLGNEQDADEAVRAAHAAFDGWSQTPATERAAWLQKIHHALHERSEHIATLISQEVGSTLAFSRQAQAALPVATFGINAELLQSYRFVENVGHSEVLRDPVGVVACITPWNYPLHQVAAKVAPALAAGCTVILKPSKVAPLSAFLLAEVIDSLGLPPGVFNLVCGAGETVGKALASHPQVDMISFTGSTRAGKRVSALAAQTVKRVALELGGKSAAILLDDADYVQAVPGVMRSCFLNSGQTCSAHTRMLVPETRYDQVAAMATHIANETQVGDPFDESTELGPLASERQRERVLHFIRAAMEEGAELLAGGPHAPPGLEQGYYVQPTVFGRLKQGMLIEQEEVFGPVLAILAYRDEQDAIRIANDSVYGLSGAVWSRDLAHARRVALRLRTGQVDINGARFNIMAPFGGCKQSGYGRELGRYGIEEFLQYKSLQFPVPVKA